MESSETNPPGSEISTESMQQEYNEMKKNFRQYQLDHYELKALYNALNNYTITSKTDPEHHVCQ